MELAISAVTFLVVRGVNYSLRVTPAVNRSTIITPRIAIGGDSQVIIQAGDELLQLKYTLKIRLGSVNGG